jgi:hypothetical protein
MYIYLFFLQSNCTEIIYFEVLYKLSLQPLFYDFAHYILGIHDIFGTELAMTI